MAAAAFNALLRVARDQDSRAAALAGRTPLNPALLIAGHGTRNAAGVAAFAAFIERVASVRLTPARCAWPAGSSSCPARRSPRRSPTWSARGHRDLVAVPLMLVAAGHAKGDMPAALAREKARHPGLSYRTGARSARTRPAGPDGGADRRGHGRARPSGARGAAGRAGYQRPGRQRRGGQGGPAAVGGPRVRRSSRPRSSRWPGPACPRAWSAAPARRPPHRGGPVLPVPRRPAGSGDRAGGRVRRRPSRAWTSASPTCSGTATSSPGW